MRKIKLKYKKERVLISDVLPFETPFCFSNKKFFKFIEQSRIKINVRDTKRIEITCIPPKKLYPHFKSIFKLLSLKEKSSVGREQKYIIKNNNSLKTIPFSYEIGHKSSFRELSVCHPLNQLMMIWLYDTYKDAILFLTNKESFSIRHPIRVASYVFKKDFTHTLLLSKEANGVEVKNIEYDSYKSFFVYKDYSNIFRFYDSTLFHENERQFKSLFKLDVSKCFDNIYTHSITWAVYGKEYVKKHLRESDKTFGGIFDKYIRSLNQDETKGIIIGPEFSRIFAEIIFQDIDIKIIDDLKKQGLERGKDYQILRYVDDFFVFFNNEDDRIKINTSIFHKIKEYKLSINSEKSKILHRPIITEVTIAKTRIDKLLECLSYEKRSIENEKRNLLLKNIKSKVDVKKTYILNKYLLGFNSNLLIRDIKIIIKESNVDFDNVSNYLFFKLGETLDEVFFTYKNICDMFSLIKTHEDLYDEQIKREESECKLFFSKYIIGVIDFIFFIYAMSPKMNTSISVCAIIGKIILLIKGKYIAKYDSNIISNILHRSIIGLLETNKNYHYTPVEILNFIILLSKLKEHSISENNLVRYITGEELCDLSKSNNINYFIVVVILFYIKNSEKYANLKKELNKYINNIFSINENDIKKSAEYTILAIDILACPYIDNEIKRKIANIFEITWEDGMGDYMLRYFSFTDWSENFNMNKELDSKKGLNVY